MFFIIFCTFIRIYQVHMPFTLIHQVTSLSQVTEQWRFDCCGLNIYKLVFISERKIATQYLVICYIAWHERKLSYQVYASSQWQNNACFGIISNWKMWPNPGKQSQEKMSGGGGHTNCKIIHLLINLIMHFIILKSKNVS